MRRNNPVLKKTLVLLLMLAMALGTVGCSFGSLLEAPTLPMETDSDYVKDNFVVPEIVSTLTEADIAALEKAYQNRSVLYGDMHDHGDTGPKSDGKKTLTEWVGYLSELKMDFQAILDHKQVKHMYLPEWDDTIFIGGSEAATNVSDSRAETHSIHYNLIVPDVSDLEEILMEFPQYKFTGGADGVAMEDGTFNYPSFSTKLLQDLIASVRSKGGIFVHVHPKQTMQSNNPVNYWFADYTGLEVFYQDWSNTKSRDNYKLWTDLLANGKRIWATAGCDRHNKPDAKALTTIYTEEKKDDSIISHYALGDFVCGFAGIRMCVGDAKMGSSTDFQGKRLVFSVGDFYESMAVKDHRYRVDVITDYGTIFSAPIRCDQTQYFSFDLDDHFKFCRVEVYDENRTGSSSLIAIGQPIWND